MTPMDTDSPEKGFDGKSMLRRAMVGDEVQLYTCSTAFSWVWQRIANSFHQVIIEVAIREL